MAEDNLLLRNETWLGLLRLWSDSLAILSLAGRIFFLKRRFLRKENKIDCYRVYILTGPSILQYIKRDADANVRYNMAALSNG